MRRSIHLFLMLAGPLAIAGCAETATEQAADAEALAVEETAEEAMAEGEEAMDEAAEAMNGMAEGEMATGGDDDPDDPGGPFE
ncbi:hypothetical protein HFP57_13190 [Parasphingopyxis algicola]|uniref:hypothetical protein n=1 Tax=Parasphingopyxis algicola TaxID=2026624 RepID=UPI0015A4440B|nr:hypothetical protein [Parasphingopyxis algicola]QLC25885.1 hypothetical protein HFP57_13190 [Parasphingopyxis algicola]